MIFTTFLRDYLYYLSTNLFRIKKGSTNYEASHGPKCKKKVYNHINCELQHQLFSSLSKDPT